VAEAGLTNAMAGGIDPKNVDQEVDGKQERKKLHRRAVFSLRVGWGQRDRSELCVPSWG
jgi:hypothetical protein